MNEIIPIMVIVPLMAALLISAFSKFNKVTKIFAFVVAICLPLIPILSNYGLHYFGGYQPMLDNVTGVMYHPAITYSFSGNYIFIHIPATNIYSCNRSFDFPGNIHLLN